MANDKFWKSKTKLAGILTGIGLMLPGIIQWLNGGVFPIANVWAGAVAILGVFGVRDAINKK